MLLLAIVGICVLALTSCPGDPDPDGDGELKIEGITVTPVAGMATFANDTLTLLPTASLSKTRTATFDPENNVSMVKVIDVSVSYSGADDIKGVLFVTLESNDVDKLSHLFTKTPEVYASQYYSDDNGVFFMASNTGATVIGDGVVLHCRGKMADAAIECYLMRVTASELNAGDTLDVDFTGLKFGFIGGLPADFDKAFNEVTSNGTDDITGADSATMVVAEGISTAELPYTLDGSVTITD